MKLRQGILRYFIGTFIVTVLAICIIAIITLSDYNLNNRKKDMYYSLRLLSVKLDYQQDLKKQVVDLNKVTYDDNTRLTIMNKDGVVLADSEVNNRELDNHLKRDEIREALSKEYGFSIRYSFTSKATLMYIAYFDGSHILRLAVPYYGLINNASALIQPLLLVCLFLLVFVVLVASRLDKKIGEPLSQIYNEISILEKYKEVNFLAYDYREIDNIGAKLRDFSEKLAHDMSSLKEEYQRLNLVMDQMGEGFILIDKDRLILLANQKAKYIFQADLNKGNYITDYIFDYNLIEAIKDIGQETRVVDLKKKGMTYRCFFNKHKDGLSILLLDISQQVEGEEVRNQFFSNVSHELKTPLTTIRGYSELLSNDILVDDVEKKNAYLQIQKETKHMTDLIEDILMISRLNSKQTVEKRIDVNIQLIVDDILESNKLRIDAKNLRVETDIQGVYYYASHQHIYQLLANLISNGIKYNQLDGYLKISSKIQENDLIISVEDNGIGIPKIDQPRVFERFYRVDESRNKDSGGTGLGLAIVKHIVQYYKGHVELYSQLDQGSKFTVILPIEKRKE